MSNLWCWGFYARVPFWVCLRGAGFTKYPVRGLPAPPGRVSVSLTHAHTAEQGCVRLRTDILGFSCLSLLLSFQGPGTGVC